MPPRSFATGPANSTTGVTALVTLTPGQTLTLANQDLEQAPATLAGVMTYAGAADPGVAVTLLNSAGGVVATAVTSASGGYQFAGLTPGQYAVQFASTSAQAFASGPANTTTGTTPLLTLAAGQTLTVPTEDLEQAPSAITGSITDQGAADPGVTVLLLNASGTTIGAATTGAGGTFQFTGLAPGSYQVLYGAAANQVFGSGPAASATGLTALQTLAAGQTLSLATEDFEPAPAAITGTVQSSLSGINAAAAAGATVTLFNAFGAAVASMVTGSNGQYDFTGLAAGAYTIGYAPSSGATLELGSLANNSTGRTAPVTVVAGQTLTLAAEQELRAPNTISAAMTFLGGAYWKPQGFIVTLLSSNGTVLGTAAADSNGNYSFTGLVSGTYQLLYTLPPNSKFYSGYANATTGLSSSITLTSGQNYTWFNVGLQAIAGAVINGAVVYATAAGAASAPKAGVTVSLVNAYGTVLTTATTNSAGAFQFKGMLQGNYQVLYSIPAGDTLASGGPASAATGLTNTIALAAGQTLNLAAETLLPAGPAQTSTASGGVSSISGVVEHAGQGDPGTAQYGVAVTLLDAGGDTLATTTTGGSGSFTFGGTGRRQLPGELRRTRRRNAGRLRSQPQQRPVPRDHGGRQRKRRHQPGGPQLKQQCLRDDRRLRHGAARGGQFRGDWVGVQQHADLGRGQPDRDLDRPGATPSPSARATARSSPSARATPSAPAPA